MTSVQGQVLKAELDDENDFLIYEVDVATANRSIVDVKVDSGSGEVLGMDRESMNKNDHDFDEENNIENLRLERGKHDL